jgi:hypothetical protein
VINSIKAIVRRLWDSPMAMTWANFAGRMASVGLVLPFALHRFNPRDAAYYLLLSSLISLQLVLPAGFTPTFSRFVSFVFAGKLPDNLLTPGNKFTQEALSIRHLLGTMHRVYLVIALASLPLGAMSGFYFLSAPIARTSDVLNSWLALGLVVVTTPLVLYALQYASYLEGANKIVLEQRWAAIFAIGASFSNMAVLACHGNILALVASNQIWQIMGVLRIRTLAKRVAIDNGHWGDHVYSPRVFRMIWPPAWRSFLGVAMSGGIMQLSGLVYARLVSPLVLGPFLVGLRLIAIVSELSRAPFYTKIPTINRLYAAGKIAELRALARSAMAKSYFVYIAGFSALLALGPLGMRLIKSQTPFPDHVLWILLGSSFLIERYGAMHIQIVSASNRIIWHWANGITGVALILLSWALFPFFGIHGFAAALGLAYLLCYSWVAPLLSYRLLKVKFLGFEQRGILCAGLAHTSICALALAFH